MSPPPSASSSSASLGKAHARRLREIYRSAGWPFQDAIEIDLLAAGLLDRVRSGSGHETLRLTDAGIQLVAQTLSANRAALSQHEALVRRVASEMARAGRIAWCGLSLRTLVPAEAATAAQWRIARPDVFSIRNTSVQDYVDPIVHEIKVQRSDLLGDLRQPAKRGAYSDVGECWYVLGADASGEPIAQPDEIPGNCGVLLARKDRLEVARPAPGRPRASLPFGVWMALAKATPFASPHEDAQALLGQEPKD